jgi:hypothetical protein
MLCIELQDPLYNYCSILWLNQMQAMATHFALILILFKIKSIQNESEYYGIVLML